LGQEISIVANVASIVVSVASIVVSVASIVASVASIVVSVASIVASVASIVVSVASIVVSVASIVVSVASIVVSVPTRLFFDGKGGKRCIHSYAGRVLERGLRETGVVFGELFVYNRFHSYAVKHKNKFGGLKKKSSLCQVFYRSVIRP
jgi:hypothetical protein